MRFNRIKKTFKEPKVLLVRHGHTKLNNTDKSEDRIRGWLDVPLNDLGIHDAEDAAKELKKESVDSFFSSDLIRAKQTAEVLMRDFPKAPVVYTNTLRPWNLGIYQGQKTQDILEDLNTMVKRENIIPTDGESFKNFRERYLGELIKIINLAVRKKEVIVIVTHFRNLKTADAWIEAGGKPDMVIDHEVMITDKFKPGEIFELPLDKVHV